MYRGLGMSEEELGSWGPGRGVHVVIGDKSTPGEQSCW